MHAAETYPIPSKTNHQRRPLQKRETQIDQAFQDKLTKKKKKISFPSQNKELSNRENPIVKTQIGHSQHSYNNLSYFRL